MATFGGLEIAYDDRVLRPRSWTEQQARWAADMLLTAPAGPVLELYAGAGQIGLLAILDRPRRLVSVDRSSVACRYVRWNALAAGLADLVEVRERDVSAAVEPGERFALVIADPPWVPSSRTGDFAADPPEAIDGGPDGLDSARTCLEVASTHLLPGGSILLQLGSRTQACTLSHEVRGLVMTEVRQGEGGVLARLRPR